jgi:hypothetical protein
MPELKLIPLEELLSEDDREKLMLELRELDVMELPPEQDEDVEVEESLDDEHFADFLDRLEALDIAASVYLPVEFDATFNAGDFTFGSALTLQEALKDLRAELELLENPDEEEEDELNMAVISEQFRYSWEVFSRAAASCVARQLPLLLQD